MLLKLNVSESGPYILSRMGLLIGIMNISRIYHHWDVDDELANTMYVFANVRSTDIGEFDASEYDITANIDVPVVCYDKVSTFRWIINNKQYDVLIKIDGHAVVAYKKHKNVIYASDFFHYNRCLPVAVMAVGKLVEVISDRYPEVIKKKAKVPMLVDMGDVVVDLWSGQEYQKYEINEKLKKDVIDELKNIFNK